MKKTLLAVLTISAIAGLTACGGGKSNSGGKTITAYEKERLESAKQILKAEYGNFDEQNQCAVAKAPDGVQYCLGFDTQTAQGAAGDKAYNLLAYSKGKIINGVFKPIGNTVINGMSKPDDDGVYTILRYTKSDKGYQVTNRLAFVKAWDKDETHYTSYILNGSGGPVSRFGWYTYRTSKTADQTIETLKIYAPDKDTFKAFLTLNTVYADKASNSNMHAKVYPDGQSDKGNYMWPLDVTVSGRLNGKDIPKEVIKISYNAAKGAYDVPQRLKELMGEIPMKPEKNNGLSAISGR